MARESSRFVTSPPTQAMIDAVRDPVKPKDQEQTAGAKFVQADSALNDALSRFDLRHQNPRGDQLVVALAGTSAECKERFTLRAGVTTVGRAETSDICLEAQGISRHHATVTVKGGGVALRDEGSSNGTFVNGQRIQESPLKDGDIVNFGLQLRFVAVIQVPGESVGPPPLPGGDSSTGTSRLAVLERDRRQLALLFQCALRYLEADATTDPIDLLFELLPRLVVFEAAYVARRRNGKIEYYAHPDGARLTVEEYQRLSRELTTPGQVMVAEGAHDALALSGLTARSRAAVPIEDGGCLGVLASEPGQYQGQQDFLLVIGRLHSLAAAKRVT